MNNTLGIYGSSDLSRRRKFHTTRQWTLQEISNMTPLRNSTLYRVYKKNTILNSNGNTVEPVLSATVLNCQPLLSSHVAKSQKFRLNIKEL